MNLRSIFLMLFLMMALVSKSQSSHELLMEGDDLYKKEQFDLAAEKYRKAKNKDKTGKAAYNLGNSLSMQERYEEAANQYATAASTSDDPEVKSKAYYNLGNAHFRNQKYQESIDAYKTALQFNEEDTNAKENLMMAKKMLQVQKQQQQQQQEQQENQDQQDQQQQEQQQDQQENQDQQQQNQQDQSQEEKEQQPQPDESEKKDLDKEDARKLLDIIENEEKKVQEKLRKLKGNSNKPKKDW